MTATESTSRPSAPGLSAECPQSEPSGEQRIQDLTEDLTEDLTDDLTETIDVGRGWKVLVASDLGLRALSDDDSEMVTSDLARRLETWRGPGVVVFAGDTFELTEEPNNSPQRALTAHPRLGEALRRFSAAADRRWVVLGGEHDSRILGNDRDRAELQRAGATVAAACELTIETGERRHRLRIEPCDVDLTGIDPATAAESRRFYAALRTWWWVPAIAPFGALFIAVALFAMFASDADNVHRLSPLSWFYLICSTISVQVIVASVMIAWLMRRFRRNASTPDEVRPDANRVGRSLASASIGAGFDGFIGTGSHVRELVDLGVGWYANPGALGTSTGPRDTSFGLPPVFASSSEWSWMEIEAGSELHVKLVAARRDDMPITFVERLATRIRRDIPALPSTVATLAPGIVWPLPPDPFRRLNRTRRVGAWGLTVLGLVDIISAITPPLRARLSDVRKIIPLGGPSVAAGLVAAAGVGLVLLAGGLHRGRRLAWQLALALLTLSTVGHLVKGFDLEEAALGGLLAVWLSAHRGAFRAPSVEGPVRRAAAAAIAGVLAAGVASAAWIWIGGHRSLKSSLGISFGRMVGISVGHLPRHEHLLVSALPAILGAAVLIVGWHIVHARHAPADDPAATARAWELVRRYGRGTLDYFALRDDKRHFLVEDTVVAYTLENGTAIVSPDPIGPPDQRQRSWMAFRAFAALNGWRVAALGAGAGWLPTYRASGMTPMYIGDESVVDVQRFSLEGGRNKSLRKAVNRVAKAGYTVEFFDPRTVDPTLAHELRQLATHSRQGAVERGFSMTLSRLFDPRDEGLLLALARDEAGLPAAFCQFVPAAGIDGFSLDLMRRGDAGRRDEPRTDGEVTMPGHPNGLTEFVIVRTIEHLKAQGRHGLGLHFATMRAVLAGQAGTGLWHRTIRQLMHRMSDDMQIESLWRFNAKFDPDWLPRYVVFDRPQSALLAGIAIAKVESLWELPFIGRFMKPEADAIAAPTASLD